MNLDSLLPNLGEWLRGTGPESDVVVSTRIRLARNVAQYPFQRKLSRPRQQELVDHLFSSAASATYWTDAIRLKIFLEIPIYVALVYAAWVLVERIRGRRQQRAKVSTSWSSRHDRARSCVVVATSACEPVCGSQVRFTSLSPTVRPMIGRNLAARFWPAGVPSTAKSATTVRVRPSTSGVMSTNTRPRNSCRSDSACANRAAAPPIEAPMTSGGVGNAAHRATTSPAMSRCS